MALYPSAHSTPARKQKFVDESLSTHSASNLSIDAFDNEEPASKLQRLRAFGAHFRPDPSTCGNITVTSSWQNSNAAAKTVQPAGQSMNYGFAIFSFTTMNTRFLCPSEGCDAIQMSESDHLAHIRSRHMKSYPSNKNRFTCRNCDKKNDVLYDTYQRHYSSCYSTQPYSPSSDNTFDMDYGNDDAINMANGQEIPFEENNVTEKKDYEQEILQVLETVKDICDDFWVSKLADTSITQKVIDDICKHQKELILSVLNLFNIKNIQLEKVHEIFEDLWKNSKSEYLRKKELEASDSFIKPKPYALNDRIESVANIHHEDHVIKRDFMAQVSIKSTLLAVFQNEDICKNMILPSSYSNATIYSHPFSGRRGKELYKELRGDYIAIQLYMDDYGTTNPLQTATASIYKMKGCYFKILNLPTELHSAMEHIFLCFLAYADDMKEKFHENLRATVIPQLKDLEQNGIDIVINGRQKFFPVVLFNIVADNLELQIWGGYKQYFSGDKCCRVCDFSYEEIRNLTEVDNFRLKTVEDYDNIINSGDQQIIKQNGLKENSCLNDLHHFHVQSLPSVDMMHDIYQGFIRHFLPMVLKSFDNYESVWNAIKDFPFYGKDARNIPRPVDESQLKERLKGMTAATISTFVRLLPLLLAPLNPADDNEEWKLLLKFQRIYDIIMAFDITNEMLSELKILTNQFFAKYKELEGKVTIKLHNVSHYPYIIELYGSLRHLWSMRYEAKHQMFKQYSNVNRCVKSLPMTLAWKHQVFTFTVLQKMKKDNYIDNTLSEIYKRNYKKDAVVVLNIIDNLPIFGRILAADENDIFTLQLYRTLNFDEKRYCYVVSETLELQNTHPKEFHLIATMQIYHGQYIRLPYALKL